jgi:GNAT superfamily N-acetyltransferase
MSDTDTITSVITYLEMTERPTSPTPALPAKKIALLKADMPTVSYYRYLYNTIGKDWLWWERREMSDADLIPIIHDDKVEVYTLFAGGVPAGYGELDRRNAPDIELAYFGLMPEFIGQRLGGYFLRWLIDQAWTYDPKRLFVHTCTEDHPAAIHNYQRHGFVPYDQVSEEIPNPAKSGLFE